MARKKRIIFGLIMIFLCGVVTGAAVMPVVIHTVVGNPYARDTLANRVFNSKFIDELDLSLDQRDMVTEITARYVDKYRNIRENFSKERFQIYNEFSATLSEVLTPVQYEHYRIKSDKHFEERRAYHEKMEKGIKDEKKIEYTRYLSEKEGKERFKAELKYYDKQLEKKYGED